MMALLASQSPSTDVLIMVRRLAWALIPESATLGLFALGGLLFVRRRMA